MSEPFSPDTPELVALVRNPKRVRAVNMAKRRVAGMIDMKVEVKEPKTPAPAVVGTTSDVTISSFSWSPVVQSVKSVGSAIAAGDAGELAVKLYGPALERLADS